MRALRSTVGLALVVAVAGPLLLPATPAQACLLPCSNGPTTGTILGGGMPDVLLGLFVGIVIALVASRMAFRAGQRKGLGSDESTRSPGEPPTPPAA